MHSLMRLIIFVVALGLSGAAWSFDLSGQWDIKVEDKNHQVVTTLVVEFTDQPADSCMSGNWMRVTVISSTTTDERFFPRSQPLSFEIRNGDQLYIGRNEICDAYLRLNGPLNGEEISGDYYSLGLRGGSPLGFFTLNRSKK